MTQEETQEGNILIAKFMGIEFHPTEAHLFKYHCSWNDLMPVIDKIHDLEEDYPVVENNFHVSIMKRFVRIIYDYDGYCNKDINTKESFERFQNSSKDYKYSIFDNDRNLAVWTAIVDFIEWWNKQPVDTSVNKIS